MKKDLDQTISSYSSGEGQNLAFSVDGVSGNQWVSGADQYVYNAVVESNGILYHFDFTVDEYNTKYPNQISNPEVKAVFASFKFTSSVKEGITVDMPMVNQEVSFPLTIKGSINGNGWNAFEGQAGSVQVLDANGKAIIQGAPLPATTDWTQPPVSFQAVLGDAMTMSKVETQTGTLVFTNENAKGDPENSKELRVPVKFIK